MIREFALLLVLCAACAEPVEIPIPNLDAVDPDIVRAIDEARAAVSADPSSGAAWGALADRYVVHQFFDEAGLCYERAEELEPESYKWAYRLGWCRFRNGRDDALPPMERALEILGDVHGPAHEAYAQILVRAGHVDEAEEQFRIASEMDPSGAHSETGLGLIELKRGDYEAAREHLEEALRRDPQHSEAHVAIARAYAALGRDEDARRHAEFSRKLPTISHRGDSLIDPQLPPAGASARIEHGLLLEKSGRGEEAMVHYRIAIDSDPAELVPRMRLAILLERSERRDEAIEVLRAAVDTGVADGEMKDYLQKLEKRRRRAQRAADQEP